MDFDDEDDATWALSDECWGLLLSAVEVAVDEFREDLVDLGTGRRTFGGTSMCLAVPRLFLARYDAAFAAAFLEATRTVGTKLQEARAQGKPYPDEDLPGCVAEELALDAILDAAKVQIDLRTDEGLLTLERQEQFLEEIAMLRDVAFADRDFEFLFDASKDGAVEDPGLAAHMRFCNLAYDDWFTPFGKMCT